MPTNLQNVRVTDKVLTNLVHGYANAESIAPFIAPVVPVEQRAGKIIKFTKENFVLINTKRAPGEDLKRVTTTYTSENFSLNQNAVSGKVSEEEWEEAISTDARIDLRSAAVYRASEAIMQSWEHDVIEEITNASKYETSCVETLSGTDQWSNSGSDPELIVTDAREAVRAQIGLYPNSMIMGPRVYRALRNHPIFRDRIKYTSTGSVNLDLIAQWFDLSRGVKVASRVYLDPATNTLKDFLEDKVVLFYNPEGGYDTGFLPADGSDRAKPAFAYTYTLRGYPIVTPQRFDENSRSFISDVILEHALVMTGLGANDKVGAGFLLQDVI